MSLVPQKHIPPPLRPELVKNVKALISIYEQGEVTEPIYLVDGEQVTLEVFEPATLSQIL